MSTPAARSLREPETHGFIYLGLHSKQRSLAPLYQQTKTRHDAAARLIKTATRLEKEPEVTTVRVFRTHLVPPLPHAPRHDLALLVRTENVADIARVRESETVKALAATELILGTNAARIGDTESDDTGHFLFNHFTVTGTADPVEAWLGLTDWYTAIMGVDNSTALRALDETSRFPLVNYVRLPTAPAVFLLNQLRRPSFHRVVRGTLKSRQMRSLPGFYRMIR